MAKSVREMIEGFDTFASSSRTMDDDEFARKFYSWWKWLSSGKGDSFEHNHDGFFTICLSRQLEYIAYLEMMRRKIRYKSAAGKDWDGTTVARCIELVDQLESSGWQQDLMDIMRDILGSCKNAYTVLCCISNLYKHLPRSKYSELVYPFVGWSAELKGLLLSELAEREKIKNELVNND